MENKMQIKIKMDNQLKQKEIKHIGLMEMDWFGSIQMWPNINIEQQQS